MPFYNVLFSWVGYIFLQFWIDFNSLPIMFYQAQLPGFPPTSFSGDWTGLGFAGVLLALIKMSWGARTRSGLRPCLEAEKGINGPSKESTNSVSSRPVPHDHLHHPR